MGEWDRKFKEASSSRRWKNHFRGATSPISASEAASTFGADNPSPAAVQHALNLAGASPQLTEDGQIGPMSLAAIRAFQSAHGLSVDGVPGPMTLGALGFQGATGIAGGAPSSGPTSSAPTSQIVLADKSTPLTPAQAAKAFSAAYQKVVGKVPAPEVLNLLLSQSAFETGNWGRGIHNYNFGNAKATSHDKYVQYFRCSEVINGVETFFDPPSPVCKFAAFPDAESGAVAYINLLKGRSNWWNGLHTGNVAGFVQGLTSPPAYFTADPNIYGAGLNRLFMQYADLATQWAVPIGLGIGVLAAILGGVGTLGILAYEKGWIKL